MNISIKNFTRLGRAEGVSLLLLLFVAMPVKYILHEPLLVRIIGMAHGLLFLGYCAVAFILSQEQCWSYRKLMMSFVCSIIPGGTFYFERKWL